MQTAFDNTLSFFYDDNGNDQYYKIRIGPDLRVPCKIWESCGLCGYHGRE